MRPNWMVIPPWFGSKRLFESIFISRCSQISENASRCWKFPRLRFLLRAVLKTEMSMEHWWNDTDRRNPMYLDRNRSHTTLFTANSIWNDPGSKTGRCGERPVTTHVGHDTVFEVWKNQLFSQVLSLLSVLRQYTDLFEIPSLRALVLSIQVVAN